jgi:predicted  nucleic acid-binding Zn-ribbon protein
MRRAVQLAESDYEEVQMESRIARLESDVAHIQKDVVEIKTDMKGLRDKVEADMKDLRDRVESGFTEIRQSIAQLSLAMEKAYGKSKVDTIGTRVWALSTLGGILLLMARVFKWI